MAKVTGKKADGKRVRSGKIMIIETTCPYCAHHKAWSKPSCTECSRCHRRIN